MKLKILHHRLLRFFILPLKGELEGVFFILYSSFFILHFFLLPASSLHAQTDAEKEQNKRQEQKIEQLAAQSMQARESGNIAEAIRLCDEEIALRHKQRHPYYLIANAIHNQAINYSLQQLGLETVFVSRTVRDNMITYSQITPEMMQEYLVIVNCTPCGMAPHYDECPDIPYDALTSRHILYDLIYNPDETLFLKKGKQQGAMTKNGLEMLLLQADESWRLWNK